jgi:hypothetical protein
MAGVREPVGGDRLRLAVLPLPAAGRRVRLDAVSDQDPAPQEPSEPTGNLGKATDEITALIRERLPLSWSRDDDLDEIAWPIVAAGFLARGAVLLDSIADLHRRGKAADGQILLRVLLEHTTTFCWIAIDPASNVAEWRRWDDYRSKKTHNDAAGFGIKVLTDEKLAEIGDPPKPRGVPQLAEAVDRHWSKCEPAFRDEGILTFRGLYAAIYRRTSKLVHPTQEGMERHAELSDDDATISAEERPGSPPDLPGLGLAAMGFALIVYAHHFDWPDRDFIAGIVRGLAPSGAA